MRQSFSTSHSAEASSQPLTFHIFLLVSELVVIVVESFDTTQECQSLSRSKGSSIWGKSRIQYAVTCLGAGTLHFTCQKFFQYTYRDRVPKMYIMSRDRIGIASRSHRQTNYIWGLRYRAFTVGILQRHIKADRLFSPPASAQKSIFWEHTLLSENVHAIYYLFFSANFTYLISLPFCCSLCSVT